MFKNYLKTALRNLKRNVVYSIINVVGLAIGMACCIVIMLFVMEELSWDRYHENAEKIFRVTRKTDFQDQEMHYANTRNELSSHILEEIPEVKNTVRIRKWGGNIVRYGEKKFDIDQIYADPSLFEVFTFPLIRGDRKTVLNDPNSVVILEDLAKSLFGDRDPMGEIISISSTLGKYDLCVTGIMKEIPKNSHFWFNVLVPFKNLEEIYYCSTYLLLKDKKASKTVEEKIPIIVKKHFGEEYASRIRGYSLQPITDIHLKSDLLAELGRNSNISYSYTYSGVAIAILLIACINFMNLSTARSSRRSKEVGIRKVAGAGKKQLVLQFIGESVILAFMALIIAILIAYLLLPLFNELASKNLKLDFLGNPFLYIGLFGLTLFVGLLAGSYPAFFLSAFKPIQVIKGEKRDGTRLGGIIRKGLVIVQFAASLVFIIGAIVVFHQLHYVSEKDLGFDSENVLRIHIGAESNYQQKGNIFINEFSKNPNILEA
ncbi:MAG: ABC transporter permease, partial [bacterium]